MDRESVISKISQIEKDKNYTILLMWDIRQKATNEQTHRHRQQNGRRRLPEGRDRTKRVKGVKHMEGY